MAQVKPAVAMIDILLRGVGQVMFQNNPITGLLWWCPEACGKRGVAHSSGW
jgi:urea transporter